MAPDTQRRIQSTVRSDGTLELSLATVPVPAPGPDEVLLRMEAAPINPSDLGLLFGGADMTTARASGSADDPVVTAEVPPAALRSLAGRLDQPLPVGNEGAGTVVAAGPGAGEALVGRVVSVAGGETYGQYRVVPAGACLVLPEGTEPAEAASCFVNPLTALGMVETMRMEGHTALVHTAAASNLGQMLQKICTADGVGLVNVVRRPEQEALLEGIGARHVCDSSQPDFVAELIEALAATGATLGFDATGGGKLASQLLTAMETAASRDAAAYSRYGSTTHKQVYIYGGLDPSPTILTRGYGMAWGLGGWLLPHFLARAGGETVARMRQRVADELTTTFASHYHRVVSLAEALSLEAMGVYGRQRTGEKYLIAPQRGLD